MSIVFAAFHPWQAFVGLIVDFIELLFKLTMSLGVPSYILAIFILTVIIKLLTQPLINKQMRSTRQMQLLTPQREEIQKRYANNPQKMNQLISELYKENNASPMAGCLPMLVQMPIIMAFYGAIRQITTVGPDFPEYFHMAWFGGNTLPLGDVDPSGVVFPLAAAGATLLQQLLTSGGLKDKTQRTMLLIMPVMFFFFVRRFPVLLAFYWIFYSLISALILWPLKRKWNKEDKEKAEAMRLAREAEEQQKLAKKNAAREAARKRAEERKKELAKAAAKAGKPVPVREPSFFDMLDDPDYFDEKMDEDVLEAEKAFRQWLRDQGVEQVRSKKFREHPWSDRDEVVEMCYCLNGSEYALRDMRAKYEQLRQNQAAQAAAAAMFGFGRKKKDGKKDSEKNNSETKDQD